jgi:hypothetical protein
MGRLLPLLCALPFVCTVGLAGGQEVTRSGNAVYISGGVGAESRQDIMLSLPDYNLRVTTAAQGSGAFLAGVELDIVDDNGVAVVSTTMNGPILLARIPPGRYQIRAAFSGRTDTRSVTVGARGARDVFFYWVVPGIDTF